MRSKETVFVGLSGGVDSSVAALRLLREGYDVVGVFIKVWQPDFIHCNWEEERLDAMRVASKLEIPFLTFDAEDAYKREVVDYMIREYEAGRTPNPDVMCNRFVKFDAFLNFALKHGAGYIATGHYAQIKERGGTHVLMRGYDSSKDQSYFLWTLSTHVLSKSLFPVGMSKKEDIRSEAREAGLITASKRDSQGICFIGEVDMKQFLAHFIDVKEGDVLNINGEKIGHHNGSVFFTLGERHGFTITQKEGDQRPLYVVSKDMAKNTITVDTTRPLLRTGHIELQDVVNRGICMGKTYSTQARYRQPPFDVRVVNLRGNSLELELWNESVETPMQGQSCVLYDGDILVGGGIIS